MLLRNIFLVYGLARFLYSIHQLGFNAYNRLSYVFYQCSKWSSQFWKRFPLEIRWCHLFVSPTPSLVYHEHRLQFHLCFFLLVYYEGWAAINSQQSWVIRMGQITSFGTCSLCSRRCMPRKCALHQLYIEEGQLEIYHLYDCHLWIILVDLLFDYRHLIVQLLRLLIGRSLQKFVLDQPISSNGLLSVHIFGRKDQAHQRR